MFEDMVIRKFMRGTFYRLIAGDEIGKFFLLICKKVKNLYLEVLDPCKVF